MSKMVEKELIAPSQMRPNFKEVLFPPLKSCLDDDWESALRFTTIVFMRKFLYFMRHEFEPDSLEIRDIYP